MVFQLFTKSTIELNGLATSDDIIILIQDGVYAGTQLAHLYTNVYVLDNDLRASGMSMSDYPASISIINEDEWVALCAKHAPVVSLS